MQTKLVKFFMLALVLACVGGCSYMPIEQLQALEATANAALAEAKEASVNANRASNLASEASYEAGQATRTANSALECCNDNATRLDRMFEKAMMK